MGKVVSVRNSCLKASESRRFGGKVYLTIDSLSHDSISRAVWFNEDRCLDAVSDPSF